MAIKLEFHLCFPCFPLQVARPLCTQGFGVPGVAEGNTILAADVRLEGGGLQLYLVGLWSNFQRLQLLAGPLPRPRQRKETKVANAAFCPGIETVGPGGTQRKRNLL